MQYLIAMFIFCFNCSILTILVNSINAILILFLSDYKRFYIIYIHNNINNLKTLYKSKITIKKGQSFYRRLPIRGLNETFLKKNLKKSFLIYPKTLLKAMLLFKIGIKIGTAGAF